MPSEQWVIPGALIFLSGITSSKSGNPASLRTFGDPPSKVKFSNPFPSVLPTATVSVSGTFHFSLVHLYQFYQYQS